MPRIAVTAALLIAIASVASAQSPVPVSGRVFDQTGAVLPGVTVDFVAGDTRLTTTSDENGHYRITFISGGT